MRPLELFSLLFLTVVVARSTGVNNNEDDPRLPLGEKEFRQELKSGLHLVEFYSPHCPHCVEFAPTWHAAWRRFRGEGKRLNISFVQVNCIKDGDLCSEEAISAFPSIKLYGPNGFIKNYPNEYGRAEIDLINFARQEALDPVNMEVTELTVSSKFLQAQEFNELLAGKVGEPYFVSFWPSDDEKDPLVKDKGYEFCPDCQSFQQLWQQITRKLLIHGVATGHVNCKVLPNLCNEMGFHDLVRGPYAYPRVVLVLPSNSGNNLFFYENGFSSSLWPYEDFVARVIYNSKSPEVSREQIIKWTHQEFQFPETKDQSPPLQALHFVFSYNPENAVREDFHVLEHLVRHLARIPNAYLHKSKDDVPMAAKMTLDYMYEKINYNESEAMKSPKSDYLKLNLIPESPTFYVFKEGDWTPHLYIGDSTTEMRNIENIAKWFNASSLPVISEVTHYNFNRLLSFRPSEYDAVVILLVNLTDAKSIGVSNEQLKSFITAAYDYEDVRMQNVIDVRARKRAEKSKKVKKLKAAGASSRKISNAYDERIDFEDKNKIILGYVDISRGANILEDLGFQKDGKEYESGDILLVESASSSFIEKDIFGNRLTVNSMYSLKETLVKSLIPELSPFHGLLERQELCFNYDKSLDIFEPMITYKTWRYFFMVGALVLLLYSPSFYKQFKISRKYRAKRNTTGLLGETNKRSKD